MDKEDEKVLIAYINQKVATAENEWRESDSYEDGVCDGISRGLRDMADDFDLDLDSKGNDGE